VEAFNAPLVRAEADGAMSSTKAADYPAGSGN
jgi:hypothetical protein